MFDALVRHNMPDELEDWDNLCNDSVEQAESFDVCKKRCEDDKKCFQFSFDSEVCGLMHSIHLGQRQDPKDNKKWRSGWLRSRIEEWRKKQPPCKPKFPNI